MAAVVVARRRPRRRWQSRRHWRRPVARRRYRATWRGRGLAVAGLLGSWRAWLLLLGLAWALWPSSAPAPLTRPGTMIPPRQVTVWRDDLGRTVTMDLETYVMGVVAAEMPASFPLEALKAQAVAARTYVAWRLHSGERVKGHPEAVVSTDPGVDQAWASRESLQRRWGRSFAANWRKVEQAVQATRGQIMTYAGEPIFPAYHAHSGGRTEDAGAYWQRPLPYLRSVPDPYSLGQADDQTVIRRSASEVMARLVQVARASATEGERDAAVASVPDWARTLAAPLQTRPAVTGGWLNATSSLPDASSLRLTVLRRSASGRVTEVAVGPWRLSGRQVRDSLNLPSTWFDVRVEGKELVLTVRGRGHGVGMSQYGAAGMASRGYTYDAILRYYYRGIHLEKW